MTRFGHKLNYVINSFVKRAPEFYSDLVCKFKTIVGRNDFSHRFKKIIIRYKRIGYNMNVMQKTACLLVNPITVNNFAALLAGRTSDLMMAPA